ncbi:MAG: hypothetical protein CBC48_04875 [bacterium TMED88]|nr:hypothetical protein [Deltaproteobacteria bacterium]OUV35011.1 MAG: hypothetical protein CBC48_04875 [bacterium TMED88]
MAALGLTAVPIQAASMAAALCVGLDLATFRPSSLGKSDSASRDWCRKQGFRGCGPQNRSKAVRARVLPRKEGLRFQDAGRRGQTSLSTIHFLWEEGLQGPPGKRDRRMGRHWAWTGLCAPAGMTKPAQFRGADAPLPRGVRFIEADEL